MALTKSLDADVIALTGDMVDGPVERLAGDVASLKALASGGHGFSSSRRLFGCRGQFGWRVSRTRFSRTVNEPRVLSIWRCTHRHRGRYGSDGLRPGPQPDVALAGAPKDAFRLLLAHNPKSAPTRASQLRSATVRTHAWRAAFSVDARRAHACRTVADRSRHVRRRAHSSDCVQAAGGTRLRERRPARHPAEARAAVSDR